MCVCLCGILWSDAEYRAHYLLTARVSRRLFIIFLFYVFPYVDLGYIGNELAIFVHKGSILGIPDVERIRDFP